VADWRTEVVRFLEEHPQTSYKLKALSRELGVRHRDYPAFRREVLGLARQGQIAILPRRRVQALSGAIVSTARVVGVSGAPTHVRFEDDRTLPLAEGEGQRVVVGDEVEVRRLRDGRQEFALVRRILRAAPRQVFGRLLPVSDRWVLIPDHPIPGISGGFFVEEEPELDPTSEEEILARGRLEAFDPRKERPQLREIEVLGPSTHPWAAMERRIAASRWPRAFSPEAEEEARRAPRSPVDRRDLTGELIFTIDPHDAKDHDDAVSIEVLPGGGLRLGVHIADVAARVRPHGTLDAQARARATSVYPPGQVLPMLPEILSSGSCSLHHGVERDAFSVLLEYDEQGALRRTALGPSVVKSRASVSYRQAEALLALEGARGFPSDLDRVLADGTDPAVLRSALQEMLRLAALLRRRRRDQGSLFIERPEREFVFDEDGHVQKLRVKKVLRTHWIIEEFMLEANRAVARTLHAARLPLLWRVHENPDVEKVDQLVETLKELGVKWFPKEPVGGKDYQELFDQVKGQRIESTVSLLALRSLMRASYRRGRGSHFGLAFSDYTHFTSPIRRYPDLHNQRWLHALVGVKKGWLEDAVDDAKRLASVHLADAADWEEALELADHCSERERAAAALEYECQDICAADWLKDKVGERLDGVITGVVRSGLFVEVEGCGLDGFVGLDELRGDWYTFDERRSRFLGERTGKRFGLGQPVQVLLLHVDVAQGRIWLGDLRQRPSTERTQSRGVPHE